MTFLKLPSPSCVKCRQLLLYGLLPEWPVWSALSLSEHARLQGFSIGRVSGEDVLRTFKVLEQLC